MGHTWTSDRGGTGPVLLLLHPGGTDSRAMEPLADALSGYRVVLADRAGHGRTADVEGPWHLADAAAEMAVVIETLGVGPVHVFGWSDGALVGLRLALSRPDLVRTLVHGGAPFDVTGWHPGVLDGVPPQFMADAYAEVSPDGAAHWAEVTEKSRALHETEPAFGKRELAELAVPVLLLYGDDDEVRIDHVTAALHVLPDAELAVVPRATHGLIVEKPALVAALLRDFHVADKTDGVAPRRRDPQVRA